jgi:hypothetical protein
MSERDVLTVALDATDADPEDVSAIARQIPDAVSLGPRTRVTVLRTATRRGGLLRRFLGDTRVPVSRAVRCTALLVRGYVDVGADSERSWGVVPGS